LRRLIAEAAQICSTHEYRGNAVADKLKEIAEIADHLHDLLVNICRRADAATDGAHAELEAEQERCAALARKASEATRKAIEAMPEASSGGDVKPDYASRRGNAFASQCLVEEESKTDSMSGVLARLKHDIQSGYFAGEEPTLVEKVNRLPTLEPFYDIDQYRRQTAFLSVIAARRARIARSEIQKGMGGPRSARSFFVKSLMANILDVGGTITISQSWEAPGTLIELLNALRRHLPRGLVPALYEDHPTKSYELWLQAVRDERGFIRPGKE
jgi:hypothetical protein